MKQIKLLFGIAISIIVLFSCSTPKYSPLYNQWVRIKVERKDGSQIYTRGIQKTYLSDIIIMPNYLYDKSSIIFPTDFHFKLKTDSTFNLLIDKLRVQAVSDSNLILLWNDNGDDEDKVDKYIYSSITHYPKYLKDNHLIDKENDSTIILNKHFSPFYYGNWSFGLKKMFTNYNSIEGSLKFSILLDTTGKIVNVEQIKNDNVDQNVVNKTIDLLTKDKAWDLRFINGYKNYKLSLSIKFVPKETYQYIDLIMFDDENNKKYQNKEIRNLRFEEQDTLQHYFSKGYKQINSNKFNDAIYSFSRCIIADSLCFEAYYNRAYAYHKMQQINNSCIDWENLYKKFGQKPAEKLYNENCIRNKY